MLLVVSEVHRSEGERDLYVDNDREYPRAMPV